MLDLDHPLSNQGRALLADIGSYAERSPSGLGVHVWLRGDVTRNRRVPGVEVLGTGFVTVTGSALPDRSRSLDAVHPFLTAPLTERRPEVLEGADLQLDDQRVLDLLTRARNGPRARRLLAGDWEAGGYPSQSEADLAAVRMLRFYTQDVAQLERLMRASGLSRQKWGRGGYLPRTIQRALELGGPVWGSREDA
ncbi:phage NrS-1 polymerase family protein [Deinococcus budaensis]|uniref:Primase-polymerase (Primpol)-like protein n=1 Tax=Deinococcus budaensis TaxID=1665626 RepID=A0A7W8GCQ6_9DEIO|nr:hypothetical protein [Deinococcus budaensis]MBB5233185.1 primase-polymerase (primpol)-like protein [Deinococcus budaensis]